MHILRLVSLRTPQSPHWNACFCSDIERDRAAPQASLAAARGSSGSRALKSTAAAWRLYSTQRALPAALALALLYLTVMSLGLLMTAYLKWHGMDEATLSLARGLGAASGIAATFAFPVLHSRTGMGDILSPSLAFLRRGWETVETYKSVTHAFLPSLRTIYRHHAVRVDHRVPQRCSLTALAQSMFTALRHNHTLVCGISEHASVSYPGRCPFVRLRRQVIFRTSLGRAKWRCWPRDGRTQK